MPRFSAIIFLYVPLGTSLSGSFINHKKSHVYVVLLTFRRLRSVEKLIMVSRPQVKSM